MAGLLVEAGVPVLLVKCMSLSQDRNKYQSRETKVNKSHVQRPRFSVFFFDIHRGLLFQKSAQTTKTKAFL
jgi:hypothetical protein